MFPLEGVDLREYNYRKKILKMLPLLILCIIGIVSIIYFEINENSIASTLGGLVAGFLLPYPFSSIVNLADNKNWKSTQRKLLRAGLIQVEVLYYLNESQTTSNS
jgi:positive regulator of sigma E activity